MKISSRDNPKIKQARLVRDGRQPELIFVEGRRLCEEAFRSNLKISEIFFTESFARNHRDFFDQPLDCNPIEVDEKVFNLLSDTKTSQGVIVIARKPARGKMEIEANLASRQFQLVILLHQINNPANLGAILRTTEAVGAAGAIVTKNSVDVFSPKSLRAAMGSGFRLPLWTKVNYFEALQWAQEQNLRSVCADVGSRKSYTEIDWSCPRLLIVGSEGHGLSAAE